MTEDYVRVGSPPATKAKRRKTWLFALLGAVVVAVGAGAIGAALYLRDDAAPTAQGTTITVHGSLHLGRGGFIWDRTPTLYCTGYKGYDDIQAGVQVVVTDSAGKTVALGTLGSGVPAQEGDIATGCDFKFTVPNVPSGLKFYGIEVSHRGVLQYPEADLALPLALKLG